MRKRYSLVVMIVYIDAVFYVLNKYKYPFLPRIVQVPAFSFCEPKGPTVKVLSWRLPSAATYNAPA